MLDRHEDGVRDSQVGFVGQKVVGVAGRGEERRGEERSMVVSLTSSATHSSGCVVAQLEQIGEKIVALAPTRHQGGLSPLHLQRKHSVMCCTVLCTVLYCILMRMLRCN